MSRALATAAFGLRAVCRADINAVRMVPDGPTNVRTALISAGVSLLEDLGPTYVKLGQLLASRPDILAPEVAQSLRRLHTQVRVPEPRAIAATLSRAFGRDLRDTFLWLETVPAAAGSVSTVHRGQLNDGRLVAVKLLRPGLLPRIATDLALLRVVAAALARLPWLRGVPMVEVLDELASALLAQVDLPRELRRQVEVRQNFRAVRSVVIPAAIPELSGASALTMQFLDDLLTVEEIAFTGIAREQLARTAVRAMYKMIFIDGLVHADLHPGNIYASSTGEIVLLDFGLVHRLSDDDIAAFLRFFLGMVTGNGRQCAEILWNGATWRPASASFEAFASDCAVVVDRYAGRRAKSFEVVGFATGLFDVQRRHGVRGPAQFTLVILGLLALEGWLKQVWAELDFQAEAVAFLVPVWLRHEHRESLPHRSFS